LILIFPLHPKAFFLNSQREVFFTNSQWENHPYIQDLPEVNFSLPVSEWARSSRWGINRREELLEFLELMAQATIEGARQPNPINGIMSQLFVGSTRERSFGNLRNFFLINDFGTVSPFFTFSEPITSFSHGHTGSFIGGFNLPCDAGSVIYSFFFYVMILLAVPFIYMDYMLMKKVWKDGKGAGMWVVLGKGHWGFLGMVETIFYLGLLIFYSRIVRRACNQLRPMLAGERVDYAGVAAWASVFDEQAVNLCGVAIIICLLIRLFQFTRIFSGVSLVHATLSRGSRFLLLFSIMFISIVAGFSVAMHYYFGQGSEQFSSFFHSLQTTFLILKGSLSVDDLGVAVDSTGGLVPLFLFWGFVFFVVFILLSM